MSRSPTLTPPFMRNVDTLVVRLVVRFADVLGHLAFIGVSAEIIGTHLSPRWSAELTVVLCAVTDTSIFKGGSRTRMDALFMGRNILTVA